jgi:hypothetical protein
VKYHNFTPKNIFFPIAEGSAKIFGVFRVKNHDFTPKNHIFSNFREGAPRWIRPWVRVVVFSATFNNISALLVEVT